MLREIHEGETHPKKTPTQIKTVCTNYFRTPCLIQTVPSFQFKWSKNSQKEFAQTVCAICFYLGWWLLGGPGWVTFPWQIANHQLLLFSEHCQLSQPIPKFQDDHQQTLVMRTTRFRDCETRLSSSPEPPIPPPETCPCRSLHSTIHSYTFPYKEGRAFRDLEGGFGGGGGGGDLWKPGVSGF